MSPHNNTSQEENDDLDDDDSVDYIDESHINPYEDDQSHDDSYWK